jgi:lysine-N-methylase
VYYLFRYFMEAAFDGNLYLQVKTAFVCVCLIRRLFRCQPTPPTQAERMDLAHLFSREIEHSGDNMSTLQDALRHVNLGSIRRLLPLCLS